MRLRPFARATLEAGHRGNRDTMDRGYRLINFILASGVIALKKIFLFGQRHAFSNNRGMLNWR